MDNLGCLHSLAIIGNVAMNVWICVFLWVAVFAEALHSEKANPHPDKVCILVRRVKSSFSKKVGK